jgi:pimeloyl-ACP methyl ester carboxylesterase
MSEQMNHGLKAIPELCRMSFFFSAQGDDAAFLRLADGGGLGVETWAWRDGSPRRQIVSTSGESLYSQPLPLGDGRVLALRAGPGVHQLVLLASGQAERHIGRIHSRGLHLLPSPEPGTMAVARGQRDDGTPALWIIKAADPHIQAVPGPNVPAGTLHGGHWLDDTGRVLGLDHHRGNRSQTIAVDLVTGEMTGPALAGTGEENYHLLMSGRRSGCFLAARSLNGQIRLGWGRWDGEDWHLEFPDELSSLEGRVTPLAIDPDAAMVALGVENGLRSRIHIWDSGNRGFRQLGFSPGTFLPAASWTHAGLHLVTSGPDCPANVTTVTPDLGGLWTHADPSPDGGWATAHAEVLPGPAGPIEAVIYGGRRWRESEHLLIALHGGPHSAWKLTFDPLLQGLAAAGVAVVAPNQRGSTGYGQEHSDAIRGGWGGPDLADIGHLAASISAFRRPRGLPPLMLLGVSYGAFLALIAAAAAPELWSRCAAVSPFCSPASLYAEASDGVKSFLRRLGALDAVDDALGPRDLERLAGRITAQVLIVHGIGDETIPVSQPRHIVAALERAGRRSGTDFSYLEIPSGHDPLQSAASQASRRAVVQFLTRPPDTRALCDESASLAGRSR